MTKPTLLRDKNVPRSASQCFGWTRSGLLACQIRAVPRALHSGFYGRQDRISRSPQMLPLREWPRTLPFQGAGPTVMKWLTRPTLHPSLSQRFRVQGQGSPPHLKESCQVRRLRSLSRQPCSHRSRESRSCRPHPGPGSFFGSQKRQDHPPM